MLTSYLAAGLTIAIVGGCGGSHLNLQGAPSTTSRQTRLTTPMSSVSSPSGTALPPDNGQDSAILAAYEDSLTDFNAVATKAPVQANDRKLADHMDGRQLSYVFSQLLKLATTGEVDVGGLSSIHARVKQFNGPEAVIEACGRDTVQIAEVSTRKVIQSSTPRTEFINALMQRVGNVWKVTYLSNVSSGCS